jgi:F-type H+-transporting ATPase subunit a
MFSPFTQFEINVLQKFVPFIDISITNFTIYLIIVSLTIIFIFSVSTRILTLIPNNFQLLLETFYSFILNLLLEQTGVKGVRFFPILFILFNFILVSNLIGLTPFAFTLTSHIALTLLLALSFFIAWLLQGLITLKWSFFRIFLPRGIPAWLMPLLVVIEILSFLIRPLSLSIRLFANMLAGHILLYILGTATIALGLIGIFPFLFILAFLVLELGIAFLQAYVFTIPLSIYLADSYKSH